MRLTEFWLRMDTALGPAYARSWARDHVLSSLGSTTVDDAIAAGVETVAIWRAVHAELGLPLRDR
ncbi:MAG: DUF3046 domain-containing protein [Actinomycetes bacterium]